LLLWLLWYVLTDGVDYSPGYCNRMEHNGALTWRLAMFMLVICVTDPKFYTQPWARLGLAGWGVVMFVGPFLGAAAVGAFVCWLGARKRAVASSTAPASDAEAATTHVALVKDKAAL